MSATYGNNYRRQDKKRFFKPMSKKKYYLEAGLQGFFCTCNFREKDCVRESYNLLNEYADIFFAKENSDGGGSGDGDPAVELEEAEGDISDALNKEIGEMKGKSYSKIGERRFQAVDTGVGNCIFIRSNIKDPVKFSAFIFNDLAEKNLPKTRYLLRFMPILATCKADMKFIVDAAGLLFDQYFLKEPKTFSIIFNRRYNNVVKRDDVIKELADLVAFKNSGNKADLKNPDLAIIVEIIKGFCLLSVIPNYYIWKKYNITELCGEIKLDENEAVRIPTESTDPAVVEDHQHAAKF